MAATARLDLTVLPTYSATLLAIADISQYDEFFNISTPTIEITVPGFVTKSLAFTPRSIQIYNAITLDLMCPGSNCANIPLPDGIYTVKYTVNPAYLYSVEKSFLRVDKLLEEYDQAYLKLDIMQCDQEYKREQKKQIDLISAYIDGAIASANQCANKKAMELYNRAKTELDRFLKNFDRSSSCKAW